ncbi:acyl-CoA dehydrogenase family protein [Rhodococcus sp. C3V]|uniref:acyl-CoA dehydrogenase family protein n=1 Tax=Rhodococcus sp. C3V TaxID=3034165 RepID=UPI0023E16EDF|nr:acyl-CoA dehydrogenase family protein [Rhodococcus sp. C3V]MDF3319826.1 acyl-CoA/acyl-ACP dehydrogenase [Rhodococcus sp. C3V]
MFDNSFGSSLAQQDRETTERYFPGLATALGKHSTLDLENIRGLALTEFKTAGGPSMLVPVSAGGQGLSCSDALAVQSVLSSISPALGVATMMHHLAVVSFVEYLRVHVGDDAPQWGLLEVVARECLLMASASSEARSGKGALVPRTVATQTPDGFVLRGSKKPCSLAESMDLLTASVTIRSSGPDDGTVGLAILPAGVEGLRVAKFWRTSVLDAAENDEVILDDVEVTAEMVLPGGQPTQRMDELQVRAWIWFEILACGTYLGPVMALYERAVEAGRVGIDHRGLGDVSARIYACRAAADSAARTFETTTDSDRAMAHALMARNFVQESAPALCAELSRLLGGLDFVADPLSAYMIGASRAMAFHPPRSTASSEALGEWARGNDLDLGMFG